MQSEVHSNDVEVMNHISWLKKTPAPTTSVISGGQTQAKIYESMQALTNTFPWLFQDKTGKLKGHPIKIQLHPNAMPTIQPPRRIPVHYMEPLEKELNMIRDDIIEGPLEAEEPGTYISNLVITDKKWDQSGKKTCVTLDCQAVNKDIYETHEPIPTSDELRHKLAGSNRFSILDIANCFHQFEIEPEARKLFTFRSPWGIFRYKCMVIGTSPASSEIQKRIRETISTCEDAINIRDDILIFGQGQDHNQHLKEVLTILQDKGLTLCREKCFLDQPEVKWFGNN